MSDKVDNWHKLATYDTNIQGGLHATLLENNGIKVSTQALSAIPGMNSGAVLWVQEKDLAAARQILDSLQTQSDDDNDNDFDEDGEE